MSNSGLKEPSAFIEAAVALDSAFAEFQRLAGEIERLDIESETGLERARKILPKFSDCGQRITGGMQAVAETLQTARQLAEKCANLVETRAVQIQERQDKASVLLDKFNSLGTMVRQVTQGVEQIKPLANGQMSSEMQAMLSDRLPELDKQLGILVDEARKLTEEAQTSNMKNLERNANGLRQSLQAARNRLNILVERKGDAAPPSTIH